MSENRVKFSSIVESQLPNFVRENFPLIGEFLSQYYRSLEGKSLPVDILNNIDKYIKLDNITNLIDSTILTQEIDFSDSVINVESTYGFPDSYGLIQINSEIISYKSKTETSFIDCIRGFSGISTYNNFSSQDSLVFLDSASENHELGSVVDNLNIKFLKLFLKKVKTQFSPGFENFDLNPKLNNNIFIKQSKDFYSSKGTEQSFEILFKALYDDVNVSVIRPSDQLFTPSNNDWRVNLELVVDVHRGDPFKLINKTVVQYFDDTLDNEKIIAYGTVNDVEEFQVDDESYYKLKLDYGSSRDINLTGSVFGEFYIHPFTKTTSPISIGNTHIDVDSTVGFPDSGQLLIEFDNLDLEVQDYIIVNYTSKTLTQFLGVDILERNFPKNYKVRLFDYIIAENDGDDDEDILLFVTGVLSKLETPFKISGLQSGDIALIATLGIESADNRSNNWLFNIPTTNEVSGFDDNGNLRYEIFTEDRFLINPGDFVELEFLVRNPNNVNERIKKEFQVERGSIPNQSFKIVNNYPIVEVYSVTKNLVKVKGTIYNANVQSTYVDYDNNVYVTSYSTPNYFNEDLETRVDEVPVSGSFTSNTVFTTQSNHNFIDGESVVFVSLSEDNDINILNIPYFVKTLTPNSFRLSTSLINLYNNIFTSFTGVIVNGKFVRRNYFSSNLQRKIIEPQPIIRKIGFPVETSFSDPILPEEKIGILSNGVEILTYKSSDYIYYGGLEKINVLASGFNYDVIKPPSILISDSVGFGASAYCSSIEGELTKVLVLDGGFDYLDIPTITVTGGNSKGSKCIAELVGIDHVVYFDSARNVKLIDNSIVFDTSHKFRDSETVFYRDGGTPIGGLLNGTIYYVSVIDSRTVKLYSSLQNSQLRINEIELTSHGEGLHSLLCTSPKSKINSIKILETNKFYNKKRIVKPENINTFRNSIYFENHGYNSGEEIVYNFIGQSISGLSTSEIYYASVIDKDNFKLALKNTNSELFEGNEKYFLETEQFIEFSTKGSGVHIFNYPEITLSITGKVGVSTLSGEDYNAKLIPIVRGSITEVSLENTGVGYGSSEILNLNRKPSLNISRGIDAQATPLISKTSQFGKLPSGRIVDIVMNSFGSGYTYGSFEIKIITKTGIGAVLSPVIDETNGSIKQILIISGGYNYSEEDRIEVVNTSQGAELDPVINSWNINEVQRKIVQNEIFSDDGYYTNTILNDTELQYTHIYPPRKLRNLLYSTKLEEGDIRYKTDLENDSTTPFHSPILGWAYDGNPIYGPYGYDRPSGGRVRQMVSGYKIIANVPNNRPPVSKYPLGFFVEDYNYEGTGDLDEYNGRFCITPEYPNGTYAYFSTISLNIRIGSVFNRSKSPIFPYFIGPEFKNKKEEFNYNPLSNQVDFDLITTNLRRNVLPYNLNEESSGYDYLFDPSRDISQFSRIESTVLDVPKSISIINPGFNYRVGDEILFEDNENALDEFEPSQLNAKVTNVIGKEITSLNLITDIVTNIELENTQLVPRGFVAISSLPHNLTNTDIIKISGISTTALKSIESVQVIETLENELTLVSQVGPSSITGIITYFNISSKNYPDILFRENDIYKIDDEKVKILNIDRSNSRVRVLREYDNTVGTSHSVYSQLFEDSRKFKVKLNVTEFDGFDGFFRSNREFYFDPKESISIGVSSDVGAGSTVIIVNPGSGSTQRFILNGLVYINNHKFNTNDKVIYDANDGDSLIVSINDIEERLDSITSLYAIKVDKDYIGLSTVRVGLNTIQQYVGIETTYFPIYFSELGVGDNHSFKTDYTNKFLVDAVKKKVIVNTEENHGLLTNDFVDINSVPNLETRYNIIYNDSNRRLITNRVGFSTENVSIEDNSIFIENHRFLDGQKVLHLSENPCDGLINNQIYFVSKITDNKISLTTSYFNSTFVYGSFDKIVNINSQSNGELYQINPVLNSPRNNKVIFDLSHPSLSYIKGSDIFPAFEFDLFTDSEYRNKFVSTKNSSKFQVNKIGAIGVSSDARCEIIIDQDGNFPNNLFYRLTPVKDLNLPKSKSEYFIDSDYIDEPNKLVFTSSYYSGSFVVSGISSNSFSYFNYSETEYDYEPSEYTKNNGNFYYFTSSSNVTGGISDVQLTNFGEFKFENLPRVSKILTDTGSGAILECKNDDMGTPLDIKINNIGFLYTYDFTLRPTAKFPYIITLDLRYKLDQIKVIGFGTNYTIFPDLIVKDSENNQILNDVILDYNPETNAIDIIQNTSNITGSKPIIIPINNTNGFSIKNIVYDQISKNVTVTFKTSFSRLSDFPFIVGDKFLIENATTTVKGSLGKEFNSLSYNYEFFEVLSVDPNIGGSNASITYSVSKFVDENETLGVYDTIISSGLIIPEKYFPIFDVTIKEVNFIEGESIKLYEDNENRPVGRIERWFPERKTIKLLSKRFFDVGDIIEGLTSNSISVIQEIKENTSVYDVSASSIVEEGWKSDYGLLNDNLQKIHDSNYYQYFSYSVKTKIPFEVWDDAVSSLNHTPGFKKFGDLSIESLDEKDIGISTSQNLGTVSAINDISNVKDLDCYSDFDLVFDDVNVINNNIIASDIIFNSRILQDYQESVGNRVLTIDNISGEFNSDPRATPFSIVDSFRLDEIRSRKFILFVRDKRFTDERQIYLVSLLHDGTFGYINQYGRIESDLVLGSFEFTIFDVEGRLLFYPINSTVNNYDISFLSYDIRDGFIGIGSTSFGDIVDIQTEQEFIISGNTTTIAKIPLDYRSAKLLIQIEDNNNKFYFNELTLIHDDTDVSIIEYGDFSSTINSTETYVGFGTFNAYIQDSILNVDLIPSFGLNAVVDTIKISFASSITENTNTGVVTFNVGKIESFYSEANSSYNDSIEIATYSSGFLEYNGGYGVVSIEDTLNNNYQISEYTIVSDSSSSYVSEFGVLYTNTEIGIITSFNDGDETKIFFTPYNSSDLQIKVLHHSIGPSNVLVEKNNIDLSNYEIVEGFSDYEGTENAIRRSFELFHKQLPIFEKEFVGSSTSVIDIENDIINLEQHFFVTGERILYSFNEVTSGPIGIATTSILGIGSTDILPKELYAIKIDETNIQVAVSPEDALNLVPIPIKLNSVGLGTQHFFTSTNQNPKVVVTIDNMLQSPIVPTSVTSILMSDVSTIDDIITFGDNVEAFFGGDLIKINNEIMRVSIVGYGGSTRNVFVNRPWVGTSLEHHPAGSIITKVVGNYNIVDNTLNFAAAPFGPKPVGKETNRPDSRDFSGITTFSTFSGRVFLRSGVTDSSIEPYTFNYVLDDIADQFNGISSTFTLTSGKNNVNNIVQSNAIIAIRDIFQSPSKGGVIPIEGSYSLDVDDDKTNIIFTGNEYVDGIDIQTTKLPVGGKIVSVGSSKGFGYQPLETAEGEALVSISGSIESIIVTNYGSGYRSGVQTYVNVGVQTYSDSTPNIDYVGFGIIESGRIVSVAITNPGIGYTNTNPPKVVFDSPLPYSNLSLQYSESSIGSTEGRTARINAVVGQGCSVVDFELIDVGFGYEVNNVLTVSVGGTTGIPREYRGRYVDAANLLTLNKEFIKNEVIGFILNTYPTITTNPNYDEQLCKRDIGFVVDAISYDIAFGGNFKCIESGNAYWDDNSNYVSNEITETISAYEYIVGISSYIINNSSVPISYQSGIIQPQVFDFSIPFDDECNTSYSSNCCNDVWFSIGNCVGIITSIIGIGTSAAPPVISTFSKPLPLPTQIYFEEFKVFVDRIFNEEFTGWTIGDLQLIDDISNLFDGRRTSFPIRFDGIQKSIISRKGSLIDVQATLLIFVNDILQVPGQSYIFKGGSVIRFTEAPRTGDYCTILFYRGTGEIDVQDVDILETIKKGDKVKINSDLIQEIQNDRSVKDVIATDTVETYPYTGVGVVNNVNLLRPIKWCKQRNDVFVDGDYITKDRDLYESLINPLTNIIYDIGIGNTVAYVENVRTIFDSKNENTGQNYINSIDIYDQNVEIVSTATARSLVNEFGEIYDIIIDNSGFGYNTNPSISIQKPPVNGTRAEATANIINNSVDSINIVDGGSGYNPENPPLVLVESPKALVETAFKVHYEGDFGKITGIGTTVVGLSTLAIIFELSIDEISPLKDEKIVEIPIEQSGIKTDYYFIAKNTTIGFGLTSLNNDLTSLVTTNDYIDNVYQVYDLNTDLYTVSSSETIVNLVRYGSFSIDSDSSVVVESTGTLIIEDKVKVVCLVDSYNGLESIIPSFPDFKSREILGEYSWGRISNMIRPNPESYNINRNNGIIGLSSSPIVRRNKPFKYKNYLL
jgi:hypothetical protein